MRADWNMLIIETNSGPHYLHCPVSQSGDTDCVLLFWETHSAPLRSPVTSLWPSLRRSAGCHVIISHIVSGGRGMGDKGALPGVQSRATLSLYSRHCQPAFVIRITPITITTIYIHISHLPHLLHLPLSTSDHILSSSLSQLFLFPNFEIAINLQ